MGAVTLLLLTAIPAAFAQIDRSGPCKDYFIHDAIGGRCYLTIPLFGQQPFTWDECAINCNYLGTRLAGTPMSINFQQNGVGLFPGSLIPMPLYRDAGSAVLRSFPTGAPFTGETDWDTGFPKPPVPKQRQCIYRTYGTLKWQNLPCNTLGTNLCEYNPNNDVTPDPGSGWISGSISNAYYLLPAFNATKAKAVATCSAVGATVYGFEDGFQLGFEDAGLIPYTSTYLPLWTDASISGGVWRFAKGSLVLNAPSPKARPKTKCLGRAYKSPSGPFSYFKATCDKKYRFFCRRSTVDDKLTGTPSGRSAGTAEPIPIPFETVPFNFTIEDLFTKKRT